MQNNFHFLTLRVDSETCSSFNKQKQKEEEELPTIYYNNIILLLLHVVICTAGAYATYITACHSGSDSDNGSSSCCLLCS